MTENLRECPRLTDDEITKLTTAVVKNQIFCLQMLPADDPTLVSLVFMVLGLGGLGDIDPDTIGTVYEYLHKAGECGFNGYPTFFSCHMVHTDDWKTVIERAIKAEEALNNAVAGS